MNFLQKSTTSLFFSLICSTLIFAQQGRKEILILKKTYNEGTNTALQSIQLKPGFSAKPINAQVFFAKIDTIETVSFSPNDNLDYTRAPNSYIFNISNKKNGLYIPVKKAYAMWKNNSFLNNTIPSGKLTADLHWEDQPGLIEKVKLIKGKTDSNSLIKVYIDKSKGKGNALVNFKVNGTIYWSWHIWVTDNPITNGVKYGGFRADGYRIGGNSATLDKYYPQRDAKGKAFTPQYMNRNLGATSASLKGHEWAKAGGLMYQWGRKDPFPSFRYRDNTYYSITTPYGEITQGADMTVINPTGKLKELKVLNVEGSPNTNIKKSIHQPITYFINKDFKHWTGDSDYPKDLWADNNGGVPVGNSTGSGISTGNKSQANKRKSEFDPCPNGWRVPSYASQTVDSNMESPWGRSKGTWTGYPNNAGNYTNDKANGYGVIKATKNYKFMKDIQVYPTLGFDFTETKMYNDKSKKMNMGIFPLTGHYTAPDGKVGFLDNFSEGDLWGATPSSKHTARGFSYAADAERGETDSGANTKGLYTYNPFNNMYMVEGHAVRCMKDMNKNLLIKEKTYNFPTEYFFDRPDYGTDSHFTEGLTNPNSYLFTKNSSDKTHSFPVIKAYSVYNQHLSKHLWPIGQVSTKVLWTSNTALISDVKLDKATLYHKKTISYRINKSQSGNALLGLQVNGKTIWSWHIWVTEDDALTNTVKHITEETTNSTGHIVKPTHSGFPILTTTFMDRNLGALKVFTSNDDNAKDAIGLHYQWGRKDPLPIVNSESIIFVGKTKVKEKTYKETYTKAFIEPAGTTKSEKIQNQLKYATENPLTFIYHTGKSESKKPRDWLSKGHDQAPYRWGHGTAKSTFDPCPMGWRVPDMSFVFTSYDGTNTRSRKKGNSPWYYGNIKDITNHVIPRGFKQNAAYPIGTTGYPAKVFSNGYEFDPKKYNIGNIPKSSTRGHLAKINPNRTGLWSAALTERLRGRAFSLIINNEKNSLYSGNEDFQPEEAMNVRCAKDQPRFFNLQSTDKKTSPTSLTNSTAVNSYTKIELTTPEILKVRYSNPVKEYIDLITQTNQDFEYKIYNFQGILQLEGTSRDNKINVTSLTSALYIVNILIPDPVNGTYIKQFTIIK